MTKFRNMVSEKIKWLNDHKIPVRLIISVIVGIVISMALSFLTHIVLHWCGVFPPLHEPMMDTKLVLIALAYHSVYAVIAAYVTARLAEKKAKKAAFVLGSKEAIMWVLGMILLWKHSPPWYNITKAVLGIPLALLGGQIYAWHRRRVGHIDTPLRDIPEEPAK